MRRKRVKDTRPPFVACRQDGCNKDGVVQSWARSANWNVLVPRIVKCACLVRYEALKP